MATDLTDIFGSEITVHAQRRKADRQFSGFAGAHGMTSMLMGSRGSPLIVKGTIRGTGGSYSVARADADSKLDTIESYLWEAADSYSFQGRTYLNVVWSNIEIIPDSNGLAYHYTSAGDVLVHFMITGISLI